MTVAESVETDGELLSLTREFIRGPARVILRIGSRGEEKERRELKASKCQVRVGGYPRHTGTRIPTQARIPGRKGATKRNRGIMGSRYMTFIFSSK